MKNTIIFALLLIIALLAFGTRNEPQAMIEDTSLHPAKWKPAEGMLFLPCPTEPRQFPKWKEREA